MADRERNEEQRIADVIDGLPIASMLTCARDMPFRLFEKKGALQKCAWCLKIPFMLFAAVVVFCPVVGVRLAQRIRCVRGWEFKNFLVVSLMELLETTILLIGVAVIVLPFWRLTQTFLLESRPGQQQTAERGAETLGDGDAKAVIGHGPGDEMGSENAARAGSSETEHAPHLTVRIVESIELLVMLFTIVIISIGMITLYDPKSARGLPDWMSKFTHPAHLKESVLVMVAIMIAIAFLGYFVECIDATLSPSASVNDQLSPRNLLYNAIGCCLVITAIGVFVRLNLHETEGVVKKGWGKNTETQNAAPKQPRREVDVE